MKRLLVLSLALVMLLVGFTSCSKSFEDYEKILEEADYDIETLKKSEIKLLFEYMDLDKDDFPVVNVLDASKKNKNVTIFEFESSGVAEDFLKELEDIDEFEDEKLEVAGKCVIIASSSSALKDAKGE